MDFILLWFANFEDDDEDDDDDDTGLSMVSQVYV